MNVITSLPPDLAALTKDLMRASRLPLSAALLGTSLLLAPAVYAAQSLDTAVNNAVGNSCASGINPDAGSNLALFCDDGGAASSSTGGTTTSQISIGALEKQDDTRSDLARVDLGPVSVFLTSDFETHEKDPTPIEGRGFESDRIAILAGLDYLINENASLGMAFNYAKVDGDFDGRIEGQNSGGFDNSSYGLMAFGEYIFATRAYINWSLGYNNHDYETERYSTVSMGNSVANGVLASDTDADEINAGIEFGYDMTMDSLILGPRLALRYKKTDIDGYTETVKSNNPSSALAPLALIVRGQAEKSLTSHLGVQLSKAINWDHGVLLPQLYLEYVHEFQDDQRDIAFSFQDDLANNVFNYNNDAPDRDYGNVLVGVVAVFANGLQSFISYERLVAYSNHDNDRFSVGVRQEF
ncbi:autotransporter outer membrane beta-barrel domain-containing protein [Marinobacter panjinensis]|uniref:Autotransporter outer membrane beta-barrel domain-containing protein n=1 Tax=Marinobacter panjinensis TaxID=2576384 RepID=A0A4U6QZF2_9GAMM|nr:autotransporter outer membrane beta-barrel domain-containing protein [Marinobacter panjinensis]MCR8915512.1 autotransporter outer membrane beta-barrel domain-containing protein [Marinobacter panjinensis]TKV66764.1 autotransporter outer membrane beta-barrel domain-containing protein [Marinobacter panjinensis]